MAADFTGISSLKGANRIRDDGFAKATNGSSMSLRQWLPLIYHLPSKSILGQAVGRLSGEKPINRQGGHYGR
jgi:hypothetical protein